MDTVTNVTTTIGYSEQILLQVENLSNGVTVMSNLLVGIIIIGLIIITHKVLSYIF